MLDREPNLAGVSVLITRPAHQATNLSTHIQSYGGESFLFPTIAIAPMNDLSNLLPIIHILDQIDFAIFVSANAVIPILSLVKDAWPTLPPRLQIAAIGAGTEKALVKAGFPVHLCPEQFNSEGLLLHPAFQDVQNKKIVIFKGVGGRDLLRQVLTTRGARVVEAEVYRRTLPHRAPKEALTDFIQSVAKGNDGLLITTSLEGLHNLVTLAGAEQDHLKQLQLLGVSNSLASVAKTLGFTKDPIIVTPASDEALLAAILTWKENQS